MKKRIVRFFFEKKVCKATNFVIPLLKLVGTSTAILAYLSLINCINNNVLKY